MTVYNFNLGIGWASSGVEYAQLYRAHIFRQLGIEAKFIFTEFIANTNIQNLTANMGFKDDEVIWMYQYFTDIPIGPSTVTLAEFLQTISRPIHHDYREGDLVRYYFENEKDFLTCYLKKGTEDIVERVEYVSNQKLIRKDYFTHTRLFTEFYAPLDGKAHVYLRRFYNEDGSTAYEEILDGEESIFTLNGHIFYSQKEMLAYFVAQLNFQKEDLVIIDRASGQAEQILTHKNEASVAVVIHAEHFSEHLLSDDYILWNNYYDYQFTNAEAFDYFIASTQEQVDILQEQFRHYYGKVPRALAIPVGSLDQLRESPSGRQPYSIMTASRLAAEKNIDWIIRAVVQAKEVIPDLAFDIYGEGNQRQRLTELITDLGAGEYIQLKGHQKLTDVYENYELYISASTSEGFGLTMLEAIGSGCAMIGLNVRYGSQAFIEDGQSGFIVENTDRSTDEIVGGIAQGIVQVFQSDIEAMHQASYQQAETYLDERVKEQWAQLIEEVKHD